MRCATARDVLIAGIMEHIEEAGVHSGDSSCVLPPSRCGRGRSRPSKTTRRKLARALNVIGLMNVQYAIKDGKCLRARSESARLAHRALRQQRPPGVPLPKIAVGLMLGKKLSDFADLTGGASGRAAGRSSS